jgi:hypothetical protein
MTDADPAAPAVRSWHRWRRSAVVLALVILLLGLRVALPSILRSQIERRANAAIAGRLTVGGVDLGLLSGALTLKDVMLRAEDATPDMPPVLELRRLYVRVDYLSLLRHTIRIKDLAVDSPAAHLERLASGMVLLPGVRAIPPAAVQAAPTNTTTSSTAPAPEPPAEKPADTPWNIVVDQADLRGGRLSLRDHVADPPTDAELSVDSLRFNDFTLLRPEGSPPGHGSIEAKLGDGTIRIDTTVTTRTEGYAFEATVDAAALPLDRMQRHLPQLGWSKFTGRLDAHVTLRAEPNELPSSSGTVTLRDLRIDVPGNPEAALAWRKLAIDVEEFGIVRRRAIVKSLLLDGGAVVVTPKGIALLPLLRGRAVPASAREEESATPTGSAAPEPAATPAAPSEPAPPWVWKVGLIDIVDTRATIVLEPPPLVVEIAKGRITGLESAPGTRAGVDLQIREKQGMLDLTGKVGIDPPAARFAAKLAGVALGRLLAAGGAPLPVELPSGTLSGEVTIQADKGPLIVAGKLAVADLSVRLPQGQDFGLDSKQLELAIKQLRLPDVLPGTTPPTPEPVRVDLDSLKLVAPVVTLTRTADGLVLPRLGSPPAAITESMGPAVNGGRPATAAKPNEASAAVATRASPVNISLGLFDVRDGQVSIVDQTVKPPYHGKISALTLKARGIRIPDNVFDDISLSGTLPGGAPLKLDAKETNGVITLAANGRGLPLQQFNPYLTPAAGYTISDGRLSLNSDVRWAPDRYDSTTEMEFDRLGIAGAEGDSLFLQKVGIPLTLALSLLRDVRGKISLTVPVSGDRGGTHVALREIVAQALIGAIVGAVTSPLKMLGMVAGLATGGGPALPDPIPCGPGLPAVEASADARVQQLGDALTGAPTLRIALHGMAGGPDVRALQEAAVLADLNAKQGVIGSLKNLANRRERKAIRDFLTARASGSSAPELISDYQKTLDQWAEAKKIPDDQLRALAIARAEGVKTALVTGPEIDAARIAIGDPEVDREKGKPAVRIGFGP